MPDEVQTKAMRVALARHERYEALTKINLKIAGRLRELAARYFIISSEQLFKLAETDDQMKMLAVDWMRHEENIEEGCTPTIDASAEPFPWSFLIHLCDKIDETLTELGYQVKPRYDGNRYFGVCPYCGNNDGLLNIGRAHWVFCETHRARWCVGSNLFSSWREQEPSDWEANAARLADFTDVEPAVAPEFVDTEGHWVC
jgi:hypothetical protein